MQVHARVQEIIASRRRAAEPAPEVEPELFARVDQPRRVPLGEDEHVAFKVQAAALSKADKYTLADPIRRAVPPRCLTLLTVQKAAD
jgi:hypothetical protein